MSTSPLLEPLTLYVDPYWISPFDCSCYVALRAKQLPFSTTIGMMREGDGVAQALRQRAVIGLVPALQHGEFWLTESMAILEYLDETFLPPLHRSVFPVATRARARSRQVMAWLRSEQRALRQARPTDLIFYPRPAPPLDGAATRDADELLRVTTQLLAEGGPCLFGEWSIADVDLAFALMRLAGTGHPLPAALQRYVDHVWQLPSVREYVEHPRPPNPPV